MIGPKPAEISVVHSVMAGEYACHAAPRPAASLTCRRGRLGPARLIGFRFAATCFRNWTCPSASQAARPAHCLTGGRRHALRALGLHRQPSPPPARGAADHFPPSGSRLGSKPLWITEARLLDALDRVARDA